jgi:hypothetical protein
VVGVENGVAAQGEVGLCVFLKTKSEQEQKSEQDPVRTDVRVRESISPGS